MTTDTTPTVSVIVTAYGMEHYLHETMQSILAQDFTDFEVIIVDDGSPDNVADVARQFASSDGRIRFEHTANSGVAAARNHAVSIAKGRYLLFVDGDDLISPDYLSRCLCEFDAHPDIAVAYTQWQFFGCDTHTCPLRYIDYSHLLLDNAIHISALIPRERFLAVGGFDETMLKGLEDWEFWIRYLYPEPREVAFIDEPLFKYRQRPHSHNSDVVRGKTRKALTREIFNKNEKIYREQFGDKICAECMGICAATDLIAMMRPITEEMTPEAKADAVTHIVHGAKVMARDSEHKNPALRALIYDNGLKIKSVLDELQGLLSAKTHRRATLLATDPDKFISKMRVTLYLKPRWVINRLKEKLRALGNND